jgi:hypothetical protein
MLWAAEMQSDLTLATAARSSIVFKDWVALKRWWEKYGRNKKMIAA